VYLFTKDKARIGIVVVIVGAVTKRTIEMRENINTRSYWEQRFSSGDWEVKQGRWQTENFARGQIPHLQIADNFEGTLLDFGCGLGDAMPIYKENFPKAKLVGIDISQSAIDICREKYGSIASFMQGDYDSVPNVDIIIASNVFEHLADDRKVAKRFLSKCKSLYIVVPYKEWPLCSEHVNTYDEHYFLELGKYDYKVFPCAGWTHYGIKGLWYHIYFKNIFRFLLRKPLGHRNMQIIFRLSDSTNEARRPTRRCA
jgi:SAM-dependent methyltransferase